MSNTVFWENKKKITKLLPDEFALRVLELFTLLLFTINLTMLWADSADDIVDIFSYFP